jgi:hypothetical protein
MLAGGLAGYLSYEFKQMCQAAPKAFKSVWDWKLNPTGSWLFWKAICMYFLECFLAGFWTTIIFSAIAFAGGLSISIYNYSLVLLGGTIIIGLFFILIFALLDKNWEKLRCLEGIEDSINDSMQTLKYGNPIYVIFFVGKFLLKNAWLFIVFLPDIILKICNFIVDICKFLKRIFILIHSDMRVLCGLDSALGAAIGYYFGNAIIGALAGGVLGVFNYKIISQKVLRLDNTKV